MKVTTFFAWFDVWVGVYYDKEHRVLYVCPVPMWVVKIDFGERATNRATAH